MTAPPPLARPAIPAHAAAAPGSGRCAGRASSPTVSGDGCNAGCQADIACDQQVVAGGDEGHSEFSVHLGGNEGDFWFAWNTVNIPDEIIVSYGGNELFSTGCVGSAGGQLLDVDGLFEHVTVKVVPNCSGPTNGTEWAFVVECLDGGGTAANPNPE